MLAAWLVLLCCAMAPRALAQPGGERPALAGRIVKLFDFEDGLETAAPVPAYWIRAQDDPDIPRVRPGFSRWNRAELDFGHAKSGAVSVRLPTRGGSTSLLLEAGVLPVFQNADYLISADVRTANVRHARAVVAGRFLNAQGVPIPGTETRSDPAVSEGQWQNVTLSLIGGVPDAAFIQIELLLLQPEQLGQSSSSPSREWAQDIDASAYFDNVSVVQLPRVELHTSSPVNIIQRPQKPSLSLLVRDLTGEPLRAVVQVTDHTGAVLDSRELQVAAGRSRTDWEPRIDKLGWYRATLEVFNDQTRIGATAVDFAWVESAAIPATQKAKGATSGGMMGTSDSAALGGAVGRARYGVVASTLPDELIARLPGLARELGVGWASLPVWTTALTKDTAAERAKTLAPLISGLTSQWIDVSFALARAPSIPGRTERIDADDPFALLRMDESYWRPLIDPFVDRFGQQVRRWDVGRIGDDRSASLPTLAADIVRLDRAINKLVPGPVIGIPTSAELVPAHPPTASGATLGVHVGISPLASIQSVAATSAHWGKRLAAAQRGDEVALSLLPAEFESLGVASLADDTVKKLVSVVAGRLESPAASDIRVGVVDPWNVTDGPHPVVMPRPEFPAWRNAIRHLADRQIVGTARVADGVVCYILAPAPGVAESRGGALIAWNENAEQSDAFVEVWPAEGGSSVVDVFGNTTALPTPVITVDSESRRRSPIRVNVTSSPVFIENVDERVTRFLASIRLAPQLISTAAIDDEHSIIFDNPWSEPISGQITVLEPGGFTSKDSVRDRAWKVSPRVQRFTAAANANQRLPLQLGFSAAAEAGPVPFVLEVSITADRNSDRMLVRVPAELGLTTAHLDVTAHIRGSGPDADVVIEVHVANLSKAAANLELTAFAPEMPRMKANISELGAGNQATRRFLLPRAAGQLSGKRVTVSLSDPDADIRIARSALVP